MSTYWMRDQFHTTYVHTTLEIGGQVGGPAGCAELQQPHVKLNSECSQQLGITAEFTARAGNQANVRAHGLQNWSSYMKSWTVSTADIFMTQTCHSQACSQVTPTHVWYEAQWICIFIRSYLPDWTIVFNHVNGYCKTVVPPTSCSWHSSFTIKYAGYFQPYTTLFCIMGIYCKQLGS